MCTNIELDVFLKEKSLFLREIFAFFKRKNLNIAIENIKRYDSWEFTNEIELDNNFLENDRDDICIEKLILVHFLVNKRFECILLASHFDGYINLSFALRTKSLRGYVDDESSFVIKLFEEVSNFLDDNFCDKNLGEFFIAASMGVEYAVQFNDNIIDMINRSSGVIMWMLPAEVSKSIELEKFEKRNKNYISIFTLINAIYVFN